MSASAATFDQLERSADNTLAWVLWANNVKDTLVAALVLAIVSRVLRSFLSSLSAQRINTFTPEQSAEMKKKLQDIHSHLVRLLEYRDFAALRTKVLFRSSISRMQESEEDIGDIVEDLVLANNPQFQKLVSDCVQALSQEQAVGAFGRM